MSITYEKPVFCPECGFVLDWLDAYMTARYQCRNCGYTKEYNWLTNECIEHFVYKEDEE